MSERTGGCQCGDLRYELTAEPLVTSVCHCNECKRQSGSAFGMSMVVPRDAFRLLRGEPRVFSRPAECGGSVACAFCPRCGSRIYLQPSLLPATLNVKPGTLDDTARIRAGMEAWTLERLPWLALEGDLPAFDRNPG